MFELGKPPTRFQPIYERWFHRPPSRLASPSLLTLGGAQKEFWHPSRLIAAFGHLSASTHGTRCFGRYLTTWQLLPNSCAVIT